MHTTLIENIRSAYIAHRWVRLATWAALFFVALALFALSGGFPPHAWLLLAQVAPQLSDLLARRGLVVLPAFLGLVLLAFTLLVAWGALIMALVRIVLHAWRERQELRRFNEDMTEAQHLAQAGGPIESLAATRPVNAARRGYQPYQARQEEAAQNFWEPDTEADMEAVMDPVDPWMGSSLSGRGVRSPG
jgi:hypothetical protein